MTPRAVAEHGLLVLAVLALVGAGLRVAAALAAGGLERALCAFTLAAAAAVVEALGLGLAGWGGDATALTLAAVATWAAVRALVPRPPTAPPVELAAWLRRAPAGASLCFGALAGVVAGWIVFQLRHPFIGGDGLIYHLPIASAWVQSGHPGSVVDVLDGLPVGNYPVTNEVVVAWGIAIAHSWVFASIWSPALFAAVVAGAWLTLRELGVAVRERALAVGAVVAMPLVVFGLGGPTTDIATTAWLAVTAGLATASRRAPRLVYPAVLAAALCLGTKTTPALLVGGLAVVCARPLRAAAAAHPRWLGAVLGLGVAIGGIWPLRNLAVHGSPLWPLVAAPWGDPVPAVLRTLQASFLEHPRALVGAHYQRYLDVVAGGLLLSAGALTLPLVRRSRPALLAGAAAAAALLLWGAAPYTGIRTDDFAVGATRYLLPALSACALAVALAARGGGPRLRRLIALVLAGSIGWSAWRSAALGFPYVPSIVLLLGSAAAGTLGALAVRRGLVAGRRLAAGAAAALCALGLAVAADGYVSRHALTGLSDGLLLRAAVPGLVDGVRPIASAPGVVVMLRGDHLEHKLVLIGADETCAGLLGQLRRGPLVLESYPSSPPYLRLSACLAGLVPLRVDGYFDVYH